MGRPWRPQQLDGKRPLNAAGPVMPRAGHAASGAVLPTSEAQWTARDRRGRPMSPGGEVVPSPVLDVVGTFVRPRLPALTDHALPRRGSRRSGGEGFG